ncbi:BMP family protein [Anoxybacillus sp. ST4]|uniref:BMP family lipoprotein n=1 Tax=Anoxybacillus sp. ST4 TaxID=2864181 RepID=UPI001C641B53|nr:BMP family ABC transporter substrate-binding protein [Anoxybacillus sp. ST4]MBW7650637.1 BMP family ABC transporter substrate-binding protein [Anoxybacillus sp. ST4]
MKKIISLMMAFVLLLAAGCSQTSSFQPKERVKIGIMLSDVGLGDQSFSDSAFKGLMKARDELGIFFDYRELKETGTYEKGLTELVEAGNDLVIGLGFMVQQDLEKVAKTYPKQQFILIDAVSDLPNITSITFKEDEGSFLAGVVAGMLTKTNNVGFVGGADVPLIRKFANGFIKGVKAVRPEANVQEVYAGNFGDDKLGAKIAKQMIANGADVLYAAAGFTGVGVLREAEMNGKYAIGVDSDQYFYAEKAVVTSMLKNVDVALYTVIKQYVGKKDVPKGTVELGLKENGVDLAPIRVVTFSPEQQATLEKWKEQAANGIAK